MNSFELDKIILFDHSGLTTPNYSSVNLNLHDHVLQGVRGNLPQPHDTYYT